MIGPREAPTMTGEPAIQVGVSLLHSPVLRRLGLLGNSPSKTQVAFVHLIAQGPASSSGRRPADGSSRVLK